MSNECCKSCGQFVLPWDELWEVVDPKRSRPAEWLCAECERTFEACCPVFVFANRRRQIVTLLSDRGLRAARQDVLTLRAA